MLFDRDRVVGPALHGRIIAHDHHVAPGDPANARNGTAAGRGPIIHVMPGKQTDFQKRRSRVQQPRHTIPRRDLAAPGMTVLRRSAAARQSQIGRCLNIGQRIGVGFGIRAKDL